MRSMSLASVPTSTRRRSASTAARILRAALSGDVLARRSNWAPRSPPSRPGRAPRMRALRAMLVLIPPGWTVVHDTPQGLISSSMRSASVKPRTANFAEL